MAFLCAERPSSRTIRRGKIENPLFAAAIAPTPVLTAAQDGLPQSLRFSSLTDFAPRAGFAWRPFADSKTVIRGGWGKFIEGPLGSLYGASWGIHTSYVSQFVNTINGSGQAQLTFPYPFPSQLAQPGVYDFEQAFDLHYKDPYVQQWNMTFERDLGKGVGLQVSYQGSHGSDLNYQQNLNQLPANTSGYAAAKGYSPFPLFAKIGDESQGGTSNYNSGTIAVSKRSSRFQFQTSYTYTRNLTNAQGYNPTAFATEAGGTVTDRFNLGLDYGNVAFSRRNRVLSTFLYQLPFGKGGMLLKNANGFVDRLVNGWELGRSAVVPEWPVHGGHGIRGGSFRNRLCLSGGQRPRRRRFRRTVLSRYADLGSVAEPSSFRRAAKQYRTLRRCFDRRCSRAGHASGFDVANESRPGAGERPVPDRRPSRESLQSPQLCAPQYDIQHRGIRDLIESSER